MSFAGGKNSDFKKGKRKRSFDYNQSVDEKLSYKKKSKYYSNYQRRAPYLQNQDVSSTVSDDSHIAETVAYYKNVLRTLEQNGNPEDRDVFSINALCESEGKEMELSCIYKSSQCLELLLAECKEPSVIQRFMNAFAARKIEACTNANATRITELLIRYAYLTVKNGLPSSDDERENTNYHFSVKWITEFADFLSKNFISCLSNQYSCHVTCTIIRALGGILTDDIFMSKRAKSKKEQFCHQFFNNDHSGMSSSVLDESFEVPELFKETLSKFRIPLDFIDGIVVGGSSAIVVEALLLALYKQLPKRCKKTIKKLVSQLFSFKDDNGTPLAFLHKHSSFVVDFILKVGYELQEMLWNDYIVHCLKHLVNHKIGNYIIQRFFDAVLDKSLFEKMCKDIWSLFNDIMNQGHYGIFVAMASACNRLKAQQEQFMLTMMSSLECDSQEHIEFVIPSLLGFEKCSKIPSFKDTEKMKICLQGSLVVQQIFKFQEPIKAVQSILHMEPEVVAFMANHTQGCHALNAYFSSTTVGKKDKANLLHHLEPVIPAVACDHGGSLTLSRIWIVLSLKEKELLLKNLLLHKQTLQNSQFGYLVLKKFGFFYYEHDYQKWKEIQENLSKSKRGHVS